MWIPPLDGSGNVCLEGTARRGLMWHPSDNITQTIPFYATVNEETDIFMSYYVCVMQYFSNGTLIRKYVACNVTTFLVSARRGNSKFCLWNQSAWHEENGWIAVDLWGGPRGVIWNMLRKPNVREQEHCNNVFRNVTKSVRLGVTWLIISTTGIRNFNLRSQVRKTGKSGLNQSFIYTHPFLKSHPTFYLLLLFPCHGKHKAYNLKLQSTQRVTVPRAASRQVMHWRFRNVVTLCTVTTVRHTTAAVQTPALRIPCGEPRSRRATPHTYKLT